MAQSEYGKAGLIGMLTPQANTTVEPEFWALMPPDWSMITARLTSDKSTIEERLIDYTTKFADVARDFANAPITALAAGCTGTSYLISRDREQALIEDLSATHGVPFYTAASATVEALRALGAKRIGLVSPYPKALDDRCGPYWESFGFEVVAKTGPELEAAKFHPIYAMQGRATLAALRELQQVDCDAVLMLGTGMATLEPMVAVRDWGGPVPLSCNLALIWALVEANAGRPLTRESLMPWIKTDIWAGRFRSLFPASGASA